MMTRKEGTRYDGLKGDRMKYAVTIWAFLTLPWVDAVLASNCTDDIANGTEIVLFDNTHLPADWWVFLDRDRQKGLAGRVRDRIIWLGCPTVSSFSSRQ